MWKSCNLPAEPAQPSQHAGWRKCNFLSWVVVRVCNTRKEDSPCPVVSLPDHNPRGRVALFPQSPLSRPSMPGGESATFSPGSWFECATLEKKTLLVR